MEGEKKMAEKTELTVRGVGASILKISPSSVIAKKISEETWEFSDSNDRKKAKKVSVTQEDQRAILKVDSTKYNIPIGNLYETP